MPDDLMARLADAAANAIAENAGLSGPSQEHLSAGPLARDAMLRVLASATEEETITVARRAYWTAYDAAYAHGVKRGVWTSEGKATAEATGLRAAAPLLTSKLQAECERLREELEQWRSLANELRREWDDASLALATLRPQLAGALAALEQAGSTGDQGTEAGS